MKSEFFITLIFWLITLAFFKYSTFQWRKKYETLHSLYKSEKRTADTLKNTNKQNTEMITNLTNRVNEYKNKPLDDFVFTPLQVNQIILKMKEHGHSTKTISDKWHTFEDLYTHRMILSLLVAWSFPQNSSKSLKHADGTMFDNSFILVFDTPAGTYSYHYDLEYWDMFTVKETPNAPEYDGHKPEDIYRLLSLFN